MLRLEDVPEHQGFSVAAKAEGVSRLGELVVQPGEPQVLQVTWQPAATGAVRGVLHLAYGDKPTRLQARSCPFLPQHKWYPCTFKRVCRRGLGSVQ